jgi:hypothetical protein
VVGGLGRTLVVVSGAGFLNDGDLVRNVPPAAAPGAPSKDSAMNFSALSIKNPIPAIMLFALLTLAGLLAYKANKVQDFPDIELPIVTVTATLDGAAPAQLETEVARKIEDSVATLQGVKNIYTKVLDGVATVTVEFILEKPTCRTPSTTCATPWRASRPTCRPRCATRP